jgi:asparagine synthase (glutamine-hydrolysing)
MCGILGGFFSKAIDLNGTFREALTLQGHRGPDDINIQNVPNGILGHNRLAIIDPLNGKQPFIDITGRYIIIFNGEIYNYGALQKELIGKGHKLTTNSDTEVLLYSYITWGKACLDRIRGMFAFCVYDQYSRKAFLARDPFGIKPLNYSFTNNQFFFSSEIMPLNKLVKSTNIDFEAINSYLRLGYIPDPLTGFKEIKKLEPGHWLEVDISKKHINLSKNRYFYFTRDSHMENIAAEDDLEQAICDSVSAHLISDVEFGAFLSGGIDSTLMVKYMNKALDKPIQTFSIGFEGDQFNELPFASMVAKKYNTIHHEEIVQSEGISDLDKIIHHFGEPFGDPTVVPTYHLSKMASKKVKMVISGDGGDEFFGGYNSYQRWINWLNFNGLSFPRKYLFKAYYALNSQKSKKRLNISNWLKQTPGLKSEKRKGIMSNEFFKKFIPDSDLFSDFKLEIERDSPLNLAMNYDINYYLPCNMLPKVDRVSMMNGLEVRTPLVDIKMAEISKRIGGKSLIDLKLQRGKIPLKKLLVSDFESDFIHRKKHGFSVPIKDWLYDEKGILKEEIRVKLLDNSKFFLLFKRPEFEQALKNYSPNVVWIFLALSIWLESLE